MDKSIEELTLLLLSLTAVREQTGEGVRERAATAYAQAILDALQHKGLLIPGADGKVTLTEAGLRLAEELEERFFDSVRTLTLLCEINFDGEVFSVAPVVGLPY